MRRTAVVALLAAITVTGCGLNSTVANYRAAQERLREQYNLNYQREMGALYKRCMSGVEAPADCDAEAARISEQWGPAAAAQVIASSNATIVAPNPASSSPAPTAPPGPIASRVPSVPMPPPPPGPTPVADPCTMMSCQPSADAPTVRYVPVVPGDPLNVGLNSSGFPTR